MCIGIVAFGIVIVCLIVCTICRLSRCGEYVDDQDPLLGRDHSSNVIVCDPSDSSIDHAHADVYHPGLRRGTRRGLRNNSRYGPYSTGISRGAEAYETGDPGAYAIGMPGDLMHNTVVQPPRYYYIEPPPPYEVAAAQPTAPPMPTL